MRIAAVGALVAFAVAPVGAADLETFNRRFEDATMRIDVHHAGSAAEESVTLDRVVREGAWPGSRIHLVDPFNTGNYLAEIRDAASGDLLFSRGFDSYFGEYKTTGPADRGVRRTYHETVRCPFPRAKIRFVLKVRQRDRTLAPLFEAEIDPAAVTVSREALLPGVRTVPVLSNGDPHGRVDLAIVGEGYTTGQVATFERDARRVADILFAAEPFASRKGDFNVTGVLLPSAESGCDEPSHGVWRSTAVGASFDSLGSERYMLTEENRAVHDIAAHVPYDLVMIMVNHTRYGGGGIYNFFSTFTSNNQWTPYVLVHELGHAFAGLADEYYTSSVAYNEFYPTGVEPTEPNITALLDPSALKWRALLAPGTAVPTPWEKADFDAMDLAYQRVREEINGRIARAKRGGAPAAEVEKLEQESERLSREHAARVDAYLARSAFAARVGAFEGAGYASRGLYRSSLDCMMFTKGNKPFCPVCRRAIERVIDHHGEGVR
ncbi:MAG: M64 family metallopeptidase [Acidobacteriota bacterium]